MRVEGGRVEGFREAMVAGLLAVTFLLALSAANPGGLAFTAREALFDRMMMFFPRGGPGANIIAIDIDGPTLERLGPWPWQRARIAALIERAAQAKPRVIALDILFEGPDRTGPRSVIARIAEQENRPDLRQAAQSFPDDDAAFAASIGKGVPVVLGLGIGGRPSGENYPPLVLAANHDQPIGLAPARISGVLGPPAQASDAAAGLGVLSLDTDADGWLRRVPLVFEAVQEREARIFAGFALESIRAAEGAGTVILNAESGNFEIGAARVATARDGMMRLYPRPANYWKDRIIPAWQALEATPAIINGNTIVVIGSSAPEAGAYLPGAVLGAVSTLRVQTEAIDQMLTGSAPQRTPWAPLSELALALLAGLLAIMAAVLLPPLFAALTLAGIVLACLAGSLAAFLHSGLLADVLPAIFAAILGAGAASTTVYNRVRANRTLVEARFARYLAPAVVDILARNPQRLRIEGERREVTALFTDLEGFTAFGERTPPAQFIATLNEYFEIIAKIAVDHGGMVDKIVGDALHVFFNMPLDQPDHAERAVRCARAIHAATLDYQQRERQTALGFGRTRIGVDTGFATVGDIGGRDKLDYTAHGEAVNRAARLQSLARDIASGVLIGQGTVQRLPSMEGLQSAGKATPRGLSEEQPVYTFA